MNFTRRNFIRSSAALSLAATANVNPWTQMAQAASGEDYRALVCILLAGGADSYNMLVPYDQTRYNNYSTIRSDLAIPRSSLLPLTGTGTDNQQFAVHPGMPELRTLFDQGELAFVSNVGTLVEPFAGENSRLPLGLLSHSDQIDQWQTSIPDRRVTTGFGGRLLESLSSGTILPIPPGISLSGTNVFQTGPSISGYSINRSNGANQIEGYSIADQNTFSQGLDSLLSASYADAFRRNYASQLRRSIDSGVLLRNALQSAPALTTNFSSNNFSANLRQIARVMSVRSSLGTNRNTFFINFGGWDHHDELLNAQGAMLPIVSQGMNEFNMALKELGLNDCVTTFTISDFARTLTSNGRGSDHGWGGHNMVMGGAVNGARIYGQYPDLVPDNPLDIGRGVYAPTLSTDEFYTDLALWFGASTSNINTILPNVNRFVNPANGAPIGFMRTS